MKDLYTFDLTEEAALKTYQTIRNAYRALFHQLEVPFMEVGAASGNMGGNLSHEFHFPSSAGEDTLLACESCGHAINEELIEVKQEGPKSCPQCDSKQVSSHRSIEVGHTFHLGTRYSEPLNLVVGVPNSQTNISEVAKGQINNQPMVPIQMGCHGIGVSRLVGAIATMTADKKGLCWPPLVAPYHVVIVYNGHSSPPDTSELPAEVVAWNALEAIACDSYCNYQMDLTRIIDDRDKPLAWKLNDAELVGYPITIVLGNRFKTTGEYEIQCRSRPELSRSSKDLRVTVCQLLNEISSPLNSAGWIQWKVLKPTEREVSLLPPRMRLGHNDMRGSTSLGSRKATQNIASTSSTTLSPSALP
jgi:prolyl-tRNA synthetase